MSESKRPDDAKAIVTRGAKTVFRVAWLATEPSGDQVDFFRALARRTEIDLNVFYCSHTPVKGNVMADEPLGRGLSLRGALLPFTRGRIRINLGIIPCLWRRRYDLVVVGGYMHATMQLAMLLSIAQRRPWALFGERPGMTSDNRLIRIARSMSLIMVRKARAIIATGSLAQRDYSRFCGPRALVYSLPYLIQLEPFLRLERGPCDPTNGVRFLYCGQLIVRKGADILMRAFARLAQDDLRAELCVVGGGRERTKLHSMIPEEFRSRVRFLGDVPFEARAMSFTLGDVFVHPARHDGWGIVIQEAMAAGLPVIGTRETGAACDLVEDGRSGFLVPAGSEEMLFRRMKWFVEHPEEIEHFGRRGRLRARCYTPEWGADKFVDMVRETVAGQSSPG